jgi:hypothetical protein
MTGRAAHSEARWQPPVATASQVRVATTYATTLSRLKHGFESRWSHHRLCTR